MKKRFTEEQIIQILKEQEAGERTADVCRRHGVSQPTLSETLFFLQTNPVNSYY